MGLRYAIYLYLLCVDEFLGKSIIDDDVSNCVISVVVKLTGNIRFILLLIGNLLLVEMSD